MVKQPQGQFDEAQVAKYIQQLMSALQYCHSKKVILRDIKTENLLLDKNGDLKLAEFGCWVHAPSSTPNTMCGTLEYLAPEILKGRTYNNKVDLWSLGILAFEILVGQLPFQAGNCEERSSFPPHVSEGDRDLIRKLLQNDPEERLALDKVKCCQLFQTIYILKIWPHWQIFDKNLLFSGVFFLQKFCRNLAYFLRKSLVTLLNFTIFSFKIF